jgi:two-component system chemotaxis sensor kinase CheA
MIFVSGFSTAKVVSDISGRGVGLDIARNNVQKLNGSIMVETWQGKGTRFQISLPLTLAIIPTLLVKVGRSTLAIPLVTVMETMRIKDGDIQKVNNRPVILLRDKVLSLISLTDTFKMKSEKETGQFRHVVVVLSGKQQMGLVVDHLLGQEEVVVKSLGPLIGQVFGIASAAILSDGQAILIIDVQELFRGSGSYFDRQKEKQH